MKKFKMNNIQNTMLIVAVMVLLVLMPVSTALLTTKQLDKADAIIETETSYADNQLFFIEPGPTELSTLYSDGSVVELETETVYRLIPGGEPNDLTLDEFKELVRTTRDNPEGEGSDMMLPGAPSRGNFDVIFSVSSPPPGATAAFDAVETYLEGLFEDAVTVRITCDFFYQEGGPLGWTSCNYASSVSWGNTRTNLIDDMDTDDSIQLWLPDGSTIPVRYNLYSGSVTDENRVYFTKANYNTAIGTVSGDAAHMEFNTYYSFDYDPSNGVGGVSICFQSVLVHEVGHALGFTSGADFRSSDIEALDIYRFQRTDGSGDYNPDTLAEFQTTARMVWNDGSYDDSNDDVNSDLISAEYRMSDGNPYQCSHFRQGTGGIMQPALGYGSTFYPNFMRQKDIDMFDAIGWDYSTEPGITPFPFFDDFPDPTIDGSKWTGVEGATVSTLGITEPSSPYSMNLDGNTEGGDEARTGRIDTSGLPEIMVEFYYQRTGGGDSPESGEDLIVEYYTSGHEWIELTRFLGSGADMTTYVLCSHQLTAPEVLHEDFRLQFRVASTGTGLDDWFVDDVSIREVEYTLTTLVDGNGSIDRFPDQPTYTSGTTVNLQAVPDPGWSFDHWSGDLDGDFNPETLFMDSDKTVTAHFTKDDDIPPVWRNQGQNKTMVAPGDSIKLYAEGKDNWQLHFAYLSTNESGEWLDYSGEWWDPNWNYGKKIVIDHTYVTEDLFNYPVLVIHTSPDLAAHARPDGGDFVFLDETNTTQYNHEIEYFNDITGELVAWVNIPFLSSTEDTILYMFYGNPTCANQEDVLHTWAYDFIMVQHMNGTSYDKLVDSSPNGWDITSEGGNPFYQQEGKVGKCVHFHQGGTDDYLQASGFQLPEDSSYTGGAWVYVDGNAGERRYLFEGASDSAISLSCWTSELFRNIARTATEWPTCDSTTAVDVGSPEWLYVVTRADAVGDQLDIFVNGVNEGDAPLIGGAIVPETAGLNIGTRKGADRYYMYGKIDEVRISDIARSDGWILTEYNNMADPERFAEVDFEISRGGGEKYGSPMPLGAPMGVWIWSNFTWQNASVPEGTEVGWTITYVDSSRNMATTDVMSFIVGTSTEVLLEGDCYDTGMQPVNDLSVEVVNLDTEEQWQATTVDNHFSLLLTPGDDVNAGNTLRIITRNMTDMVNITDHPVTADEISTGSIQIGDVILDIHYRDLTQFPYYPAELIPGEGIKSGAAVGKMFLDYFEWNSTIDPSGPPAVYTQQWIYDNFTSYDVPQEWIDLGLDWYEDPDYIDMFEMWLGTAWAVGEYGYHFWAHANLSSDSILKTVCVMTDYTVPADEGHPVHVGAAIPVYGDYSNWMAIRGIHTDQVTFPPPPSFEIYGFWINDPMAGGIGENTYKTVDELLTTYFLPMDLPGSPYENNKFTALVEPPEDFDISQLAGTEMNQVRQTSGYSSIQKQLLRRAQHIGHPMMLDKVIYRSAREGARKILELSGSDIDTFKPVQIVRVKSFIKGVDHYNLVVFSTGEEKLVIRTDLQNGEFKELSLSPEVEYLKGATTGVYTGGSPYYPKI